ncbi:helix-turn-helix transcriptional regulator [Nesterenkonia sp. PF2B19]|uniref:helix-turn-helix transcriptional regulator n=1 Tax=Nesterenkonia sp. PF2B19 TaxID=1881858 RepID=UPI000A19DB81|nr:LuxR C-terminal-related transcriptional regulator [Nesterenkonia sp. PF2B19]OSM42845.1 hypothetical protein BCY76_011960 [Nesterenkonia sp. PF2B19]
MPDPSYPDPSYPEARPGHCPRRGASAALARTALEQHCLEVAAPVVLVTGVFGTERAGLLAHGSARAQATLEVVPTVESPEAPLTRRLGLLRELGMQEAARRLMDGSAGGPVTSTVERHLLVDQADLLDEDSSDVLDAVIRSHRVGVLMTASGSSRIVRRLARVLNGPRGLHLELATLTLEETRSLLAQMLEEPPTSALARYLHACTGGVPEDLSVLARHGAAQGWIGTVDSRSVVVHPPQWLDRRAADAVLGRLREAFGAQGVQALRTIALQGEVRMDDAMDSDTLRETIFPLEEAGLLTIRRSGVAVTRPVHQHSLVMSRQPVAEPPRTPEGTLHACSVGDPVTPEEARAAAWHLLELGHVDQARFVLQALPSDDVGRTHVQACCEIAVGAPRRAMRLLRPLVADADTTAVALLAFIEIVLLRDVDAGAHRLTALAHAAQTRPDLDDLLQALSHLQDYAVRSSSGHGGAAPASAGHAPAEGTALEETAPEGAAPGASRDTAEASTLEEPEAGPDLAQLGRALLATLQACRAAHQHDPQEPARPVSPEAVPFREVPIIASNWVASVLGAARLLLTPEEDVLPEDWFEGESVDRVLLRTTSTELMRMLQDLICGEPLDDLRNLLEDIWAQFDGGLPQGPVRRTLLEALDHAVEGGRAEELLGPPGYVRPPTGGLYDSAWRQVLISVGYLLDAVVLGDPDRLEQTVEDAPQDPPHRRMVLRCLILRGLHTLPEQSLAPLIRHARSVGVEPVVVELLAARLDGDTHRVHDAVAALEGREGRFRVASVARRPVRLAPGVTGLTVEGRDRLALLSAREREVTEQAVQGMSLAEISESLRISLRTVQSHVRNTYRKLGVSSRTELRSQLFEARDRR